MKEDFVHSALPEASLSMLIAAARRHLKHVVSGIVNTYGINAHQCWMILLLRDRGPMSLSELAGRMWMDHPTTSRLVHALEEGGLLIIQPDPTHGRKVLIGVNPEKIAVLDEIRDKIMESRTRTEKGLTAEEKSALRSGLSKMILNMGELLSEAEEQGGRRPKAKSLAD